MTQPVQRSKKTTGTKKATAAKATAKNAMSEQEPEQNVAAEERHRLIAETAYVIAERRGFQGDPIENWLLAEAEVDARHAARH